MNKYTNNARLATKYFSTKNVISRIIIGKNKKILDVGCNEGYFGTNNKELSNKYYGVDILEESLKIASKSYIAVELYDLENLKDLSFNEKFDYIIFGDVLEHVRKPEEILKFFIKKYLNKNGKIIISLPNIANWQTRFNLLFGKFDYTEIGIMDNTHLKLYTFKSAQRLAKISGLKIKSILFGADLLGPIIKFLPFFRNLLSTNIVLVCEKIKN
jgi:2-polyprenyl-3-methyl-5-hydroxy-6-metoxy-1,4-benzoquinol methylase